MPTILHIPHSSTIIPMMDGFISDLDIMRNEMTNLTDWFTDELFDLPYIRIVTPFSRIFCDVERFENDKDEIMSLFGMGMTYTHTDNGDVMRIVTPSLKSEIISFYYRKHHDEFEKIVTEVLLKSNKILIIDCHSFPDQPMKRDLCQEVPRPDFCIGIDQFHTSDELAKAAVNYLQHYGFSVKVNNPYSGSIVPLKFYNENKNVQSLMIEVNRKLYMNIENGEVIKLKEFANISECLSNLVKKLSQY